jgi:DNA-binding transcriptional regulator/RsmH inhibitor MraZ
MRSRFPWLSEVAGGLLAVLETDGSAEIFPWQPHGEAELKRIRELLAAADVSARGALALAAMDKYVKLTLDPDGRTVLPSNLAFHLDAVGFGAVRIVAADERLWVWSERRWQDRRGERVASLDRLLAAQANRTE